MAKKDTSKKPDPTPQDSSVEERVKQMMDPEVPDTKPAESLAEDNEPGTAPVVTDLPVPKEPLKIKILRDDDTQDDEPSSAPVLVTDTKEEQVDEAPEEPLDQTEPEPDTDTEPEQVPEPVGPVAEDTSDLKSDADALPDDKDTAEAVDDIVRHESDELLKAEDEKLVAAFKPQEKKTFGQKLKNALADVWKNPRKRKILISSLAVVVLLAGIIPQSRYFVLNTAGVRANANVRILDQSTLQPLRNVEVTIHGVSAKTDHNGDAKLEKIKLGTTQLKIERRAFAVIERKVTIGWGSNRLGEEKLRPTGTQYAFKVTDYLSGKAVAKAEATSGEASAFSDEEGKILLTMDDAPDEIDIKITGEDRRTEDFKIDADIKNETSVKMVPARKHTYISRREGRYDVYASYADGRDETLVLKGTGSERDDMVLVPHPSEDLVALVSTRDNKRNPDGYLLSTLDIIDIRTKTVESAETSERIQVTGWFGERIVYVRVVAGASAANPKRNRLMAYHYKDDTNNELAASNYFNDVMVAGDRIYYAPSGAYANGVNVDLFSVKPDGSDRKIILDKEVWNMFRTTYDHIALSTPGQWYDYQIGEDRPTTLKGEPANLASRVFTGSPNNEKSLWVDTRDGKGVLLVHDVKTGEDKTLRTQSGLKNPVRWLNNDTIVYRIKTDTETADYALSLDGGEPKKLADVTNTDGIDRWYYY